MKMLTRIVFLLALGSAANANPDSLYEKFTGLFSETVQIGACSVSYHKVERGEFLQVERPEEELIRFAVSSPIQTHGRTSVAYNAEENSYLYKQEYGGFGWINLRVQLDVEGSPIRLILERTGPLGNVLSTDLDCK